MQADVNLFLLRQFLRLALRPHIEADDDGVRRRGQQHVGFGNSAHAAEQDLDLHPVVRQLGQQVAQDLHRALHIALQNDVQFLLAGELQLFRQAFERHARALGQLRFARLLLAVFRNAARLLAIGDGDKLIAGLRQSFETQNFHRGCRSRGVERNAAIVEHRAYLAKDVAHHEVVAGVQRSVLHQHRRHRTASAVELGFEHRSSRQTIGHSLQVLQISNQADHFHQQIEIGLLLGGNLHEHGAAAPVFRHQSAIGELLLHPLGQSAGLVNLIDRDDDRHLRRLRVVDGLQRLRHHTVIGSHDQHDDIGHLRSASTHAGEGFVTRRVEEYDLAPKRRRIGDR